MKAEAAVDDLVQELGIQELAIDAEAGRIARDAWARFGKGSGHRAKLNMGDCFAYACAKQHGLLLLFKGEDFVHTDIERAPSPGDA